LGKYNNKIINKQGYGLDRKGIWKRGIWANLFSAFYSLDKAIHSWSLGQLRLVLVCGYADFRIYLKEWVFFIGTY